MSRSGSITDVEQLSAGGRLHPPGVAAALRYRLHRQVIDDWNVGRVTKGQAEALLRHASGEDAALPDSSRTNPRPVSWDWIDIGPDDRTLRIEFLEGVVEGLHHIEIDEDDDNVLVTVFVGLNPDLHGGAYALVGFTRWAMAKTDRPVASRRISDGSPGVDV